jgi:DMSO/TMAO reductase YedYZ molybdopterin-dependent catalytic subunit
MAPAAPARHHSVVHERRYGRAAFVGVAGVGLSSLAWGKPAWHAFTKVGRVPQILPGGGWRIYTVAASMPTFDPRTWALSIDGLVENPHTLTYEELRALPRAEQVSDFHCVTGWTVSKVHWAGVRFAELLKAARPKPHGRALTFVSAEQPYTDSLTLAQALRRDTMLAYEMNGKPLPREHGAPVRVVIPAMYGYKNTKWVQRITVAPGPIDGFWENRGYDRDAWVGHSNGKGGTAGPPPA